MSTENTRRKFLQRTGTAGVVSLLLPGITIPSEGPPPAEKKKKKSPAYKGGLCLSTWDFGHAANSAAWETMKQGGSALDMAESSGRYTEADRGNLSVGLSGYPDREGNTTLDACIMDSLGRAGSVCFLEHYDHPVSLARLVLERTPHVILVGDGARQFAEEQGYTPSNYVGQEAQKAWKNWLEKNEYKPVINIENHDTIGTLMIDARGDLAGACTTSGLAFKMRGRVGDSPIIGAGLYVDNEVGAATATGLGEAVLRSCSSFLMVELMRQGYHPQEACEEAIRRLMKKNSFLKEEYQVGLLAVNKAGETGAFSVRPGFSYALMKEGVNQIHQSSSANP
jgi:N4-(beta-N-acetylglucosaminyl)-L-asparaginase